MLRRRRPRQHSSITRQSAMSYAPASAAGASHEVAQPLWRGGGRSGVAENSQLKCSCSPRRSQKLAQRTSSVSANFAKSECLSDSSFIDLRKSSCILSHVGRGEDALPELRPSTSTFSRPGYMYTDAACGIYSRRWMARGGRFPRQKGRSLPTTNTLLTGTTFSLTG